MEPNRRGNPLMVKGAPSLNPSGRRANGVAAALRDLGDSPEATARFARALMDDESAAMRDRIWAATFIRDTMDGTPVSTSVSQSVVGSVNLGAPPAIDRPQKPERWSVMGADERRTWIRSLKSGNP